VRVLYLGAVGPVDRRLAASPVEVTCLGQPELLEVARRPGVALQALWNGTAYREMGRLLAALDPASTVVHLHGYTKALSTSPVAAAHRRGFRVVCTLHDFFSACPNGAFFDYVSQAPCPRVALSFDCIAARCDKRHVAHKLFRVARSAAQRSAGAFPRTVRDYIALSEQSVAKLRRYLPAEARFHPLPNPIQIDRLAPVAAAENAAILQVGRLDKEKGVMLLAEAAAALGQAVVFVGDGPLRAELAGRPGVTVTGWLPPEQVVAWLDRARCLVFPSLWYETYGLVVDEAAARGVPAIVSDITAAAERVADGVTGWHFPSGDAAALGRKLAEIRCDQTVAAAGRAAYERFWQDKTSHVQSLLDIYASMLRSE